MIRPVVLLPLLYSCECARMKVPLTCSPKVKADTSRAEMAGVLYKVLRCYFLFIHYFIYFLFYALVSAVSGDVDCGFAFAGTMPQFHVDKTFADRRYKVASARTYFYLNEATCERNLETFQECLQAVAGEIQACRTQGCSIVVPTSPRFIGETS